MTPPLPTLETARLRIRPLTPADAHVYNRVIHSDPEVMRYLPGGRPLPVERSAGLIEYFIGHGMAHGFSFLAITHRETSAFMGHVGLHQLSDAVEVGYALGRVYWRQGYATEAAHAVMAWGFESFNLAEIVALAYPENTASRRVMERLGMRYEGDVRRYYDALLSLYRVTREAFHAGA